MKSLRVKVELVLFITVMLVVGLTYGIQRFIILPSLNPYDEQAAQDEMRRGINALHQEQARIRESAQMLVQRPELAAFMGEPGALDALPSLEALEANFLFVVRDDGEVLFGNTLSYATGEDVHIEELAQAPWPLTHPLLTANTEQDSISGAWITSAGPALVASEAVHADDGTEVGSVVVGRLLDEHFLSELYRQTLVRFQVWPVTHPRAQAAMAILGQMAGRDGLHVERESDEIFYVYATFPGIRDTTALLLRSATQRTVLARAYDTLQTGLLAQVGIGLTALVVLIMMFRLSVMNPLSRLTQHTVALRDSNDLSARLHMKRKDELGVLAAEFDHMVEQLDEDMKAQKRAEEALRASEERYALAVQGANDGLWDWNLLTNEIHFSRRWKGMLGFEEDEFADDQEQWFNRIKSDDLENVQAALDAHLKGTTGHFESEHRILHKDGTYLWVLCRGLAVRDEEGTATRMAGSQTDITPRKIIEEQLSHQALHDSLTTLPNRALFMDRLGQAMKQARRNKEYRFAVLFIDVDRFKVINDGLGHVVGDMLLTSIADKLSYSLRESDTIARQSGTVARFGGDEFVLLIDNLHDVNDATLVAQRVQDIFKEPFDIEGNEIFTSVSIGIALSSSEYTTQEEFLRSADTAMYRAKALGKARFEVFDTGMHEKALMRLELENDLRRAIDRDEFVVYYQPIVNLRTGAIDAFEALVRWQHPERGLLNPVHFVPIAEETGMVVPMGLAVFRGACRQTRIWQEELPQARNLIISVNLSVKDFTQGDLVATVQQNLRDTGLEAKYLKLEITESAIMESVDMATKILKRFREMGVQLAIDDFGTGYSSLSYLNLFPMHTLKIDRAFVRDMDTTRESFQIVKTIVLLAHALEMNVIAEGIETVEQLRSLRELQCEYGQGYFFSQPLDAEAAGKLLREEKTWSPILNDPAEMRKLSGPATAR